MPLLIALLVTFIVVTLVTSGISIMVYGKPIDDELVLEWIEKVKSKDGFEPNMYDSSIINGEIGNWKTDKYFTKPPLPILFKYYIDDVGVIWRGSKGAKALDQVREKLGTTHSKESQRKNLGL